MKALRALATAFAYFSTLPVGAFADGPAPDANVLSYLPFVGLLLGAIAGTGAMLVGSFAPHPLVVACAFAATIALSGALHVDGLLDSADALFASVEPSRRLEILKDPRHGTFAVATFAAVAVLWLAALWSIARPALPAALAYAAATARFAAIVNAFIYPYARGSAPSALRLAPSRPVLVVALILILTLSLGLGPWAWTLVPAAVGLAIAGGAWASRRLGGGLVGDVYGGLIVVLEVVVLSGLVLLPRV